jgi:L-lactate dehydrogenase (cytochrome)
MKLQKIAKIPAIKHIALTLDTPIRGKWEEDIRLKGAVDMPLCSIQAISSNGSTSLFSGTANDRAWSATLPWLQRHTSLPIVLKGIQTYEDAYLASHQLEVKGIILSNHGGRSVDATLSALHTLIKIRRFAPQVFDKIEVWVDVDIKKGSDIVKALCLELKR